MSTAVHGRRRGLALAAAIACVSVPAWAAPPCWRRRYPGLATDAVKAGHTYLARAARAATKSKRGG